MKAFYFYWSWQEYAPEVNAAWPEQLQENLLQLSLAEETLQGTDQFLLLLIENQLNVGSEAVLVS